MLSIPGDDATLFALAGIGAIFVGLSKGGLPAIASLSVPMLSLTMSPVKAAALLLPVYVVSDWMGLWLYRHSYSRPNLKIMIPGAVAGVLFGWATAKLFPESVITLLIGLMGVVFCLRSWFIRVPDAPATGPNVPRGLFWSALAGFTSFVSHSGAPPFQIYILPQRLDKLCFAGTATILFAVINAAKIVPYWQLGQLAAGNLRMGLLLVPAAIAGTVAGAMLTRIIPDKLFFRAVQATLFAVSLKLAFDASSQLLG
jgi:uncharacterized membrane protein YfcA